MTKSRHIPKQKGQPAPHLRQQTLFSLRQHPETMPSAATPDCQVVAVGRRRDGGTRYWCLSHKADATAKYGTPARVCRAAHISPISPEEVLELNINKYQGGIALWGAVPAVYDTTRLPMDRGIHVHARVTANDEKETDCTFRAVRIISDRLPKEGILVSELDAIYYMVASIFGFKMKQVLCSHCGYSHLDRDWFSVHPHRRHLCAGCGRHFHDADTAIGNPICGVRAACGVKTRQPRASNKKLDVKQADFPGGIQVWGSNPAFIWTSDRTEEAGIHVHAFRETWRRPDPDETYGEVNIDGMTLDPSMVRVLMAQSALSFLKGRVLPIDCPSCGEPQFDAGELAFTPTATHTCKRCGDQFSAPGRLRKRIANPLPAILARLAERAPRQPQRHDMELMPETL